MRNKHFNSEGGFVQDILIAATASLPALRFVT